MIILWWIGSMLLTKELYLANAFPVGVFAVWTSTRYDGQFGTFDYLEAQKRVWERYTNGEGYCGNQEYDSRVVSDGSEFTFRSAPCQYKDRSEVSHVGENHLLISTATQDTYVSYHKKVHDEPCSVSSFEAHGLAQYCPFEANPVFLESFGKCYCEFVETQLIAAAEHLSFNIAHEFKSRFESGVAEVTHVRIKENEEEILATFEKGEDVRLPVPTVLEWLGVDLDALEGEEVARRLSGVHVEATLNYYNYHQAPGMEEQITFDPGEVVCILELELIEEKEGRRAGWRTVPGRLPELGSAPARPRVARLSAKPMPALGHEETANVEVSSPSTESEVETLQSAKLDEEEIDYLLVTSASVGSGAHVVRRKDGIRISISAGGVISELDHALLFETFIQAFLLLNIANLVCKYIAYTMLGIRSRIFKQFGEHEVNYENEYAQFAIQSIVASHAFERLDGDKSGKISEEELVVALRNAQGKYGENTEEDIRALAAFIIACGDKGDDGDEEPDGEISVTEWFDLFASGHVDSASIRDNIRDLGMRNINKLRRSLTENRKGGAFMTPSLRRGLSITGVSSDYGATQGEP